MTSQIQNQMTSLSSLDTNLVFDINHIIMNYLKLNSLNPKCFSDTTIQMSEEISNIENKNISPEEYQTHISFASNYFTLLISQENAIDVIPPIISNYPNSELGLFLSNILEKHIINCAQSLDNSKEKFEKYKNYLLKIEHGKMYNE